MIARPVTALVLALWAAQADAAPDVLADVAPVHALAARVMEGVGEPGLILGPGTDPHHHALRPSGASALQAAEAVFWVGPALTPWLEAPLASLAGDAVVVALLDAAPVVHAAREEAVFGEDEHGHSDHDHGPADPHAWLDPVNAVAWLDAIAETLAQVDPEHAEAYRANAEAGRAELEALTAEVRAALPDAPRFAVTHDAYAYFERRFGVEALGAISASDAGRPGAGRIRAIGRAAGEAGVGCAIGAPAQDRGLARAALGDGARVIVVDPLGGEHGLGPDLYPALIRDLAAAVAACDGPAG